MKIRKNTVKTLFAVTMATALLIISCTGCSGSGNAYRLYQTAAEKFNASNDLDMSMAYTLNLAVGEYNSETKMMANVMATDLDQNPVYLLSYDTTVFATTVSNEVYYADNIAYVNTGDERYKQELTLEELMEEHGGPILQTDDLKQFMSLKEEHFSAATTTSEGGITKISFTLSEDEFKDIIVNAFKNTVGTAQSFQMDTENLSASDLVMTFSLNQDKYFTGMTLQTNVILHINNNEITMNLQMDITFNNPGKAVEITPPNGLDQYEMRDSSKDEGIDEGYTIPEDWRR